MMPAIDAVASSARAISVRRSLSLIPHLEHCPTPEDALRPASAAFLDDRPAQGLVEGLGLEPERLGAAGVGDHGRGPQPLDQRPGYVGVDRRDEAEPERGEPGSDQRNGNLRRGSLPSTIAIRSSMSA